MPTLNVVAASKVLATPAMEPAEAHARFEAKLALETDPSDVHADLLAGVDSFLVVDARSKESYERGHIPGAVNLPHRQIDWMATRHLDRSKTLVVYCTGVGCNASTKGAAKLTALGFRVKEMTGGLEWWSGVEGYPVATGTQAGTLR